ncbi:hypothetical protein DAPPUDRAFT_234438 [Daphnia pulex]|uniref:Uncharacterized protein n=1 Tax=Daphnia pulex TaxID=6669 RepID=E9FWL8_DAPPU|nr:hypothetical protein DAPPUDRAFT_234438 [Daphnia pulex]|eukprot:EFX88411.1 hypothetical protein DAPPUDRAFT_234438 [Daphnia pulex]
MFQLPNHYTMCPTKPPLSIKVSRQPRQGLHIFSHHLQRVNSYASEESRTQAPTTKGSAAGIAQL